MYREYWRGSTVKEVGLTNEGGTSIVIMQARDNLREWPCTQAIWEERNGLVLTACACTIISTKTWEFIYIWKLSVHIHFVPLKDAAVCQLNGLKEEDNCCIYEGEDTFFLQLVSVSQYTTRCCYLGA